MESVKPSSPRSPPARQPSYCGCSAPYDGPAKMLHSLLYNFSQGYPGALPSPPSGQQPPPPVASSTPMASAEQETSLQRIERRTPVQHRPRSSSVVSLGSTGSSLRDSYSPSHESSASHDSFSRGSPVSLGSSPSPSPPAHEGSKLFGLLKGTVASPYSSFFGGVRRTPPPPPPSNHTLHSPPLKRQYPIDCEQPMDLSCKRSRTSSPPPPSPSPSLYTPDNKDTAEAGGSILKSILCGGASRQLPGLSPSRPSSVISRCSSRDSVPSSPSPAAPTSRRESTSSVSSISSTSSFRSQTPSAGARVALAKKMMLPVRARVSDWMLKVIQFAKSQPEFAGLPGLADKVALISQAWARILLLFMAETNFEFAVTPIHGEEDGPVWDPESPSMQSVQSIQAFIKKCQTLNLDSKEYHLMRMAVLFHSAPSGVAAAAVDAVNAAVRAELQDHLATARPGDRMRYSSLLLAIHTLFGINCKMVENLFCKHVVKPGRDIPSMLGDMLAGDDDDEVEEMRRH